ncbi:MAG: hypothetical protein KatS3mg077_2286 [Candidatus Binatia bacterium]|nr:MAG: hypothetical protein KatS3mg077_2286 [Candidatus Binatia bacterium]
MNVTLRSIVEWHVAISVAGTVLAAWFRMGDPVSILVGSGWALANLGVWAMLVRVLVKIQRGAIGARARWLGTAALIAKFVLFLGVGAAFFYRAPLEPLSFAAGVSVFTVASIMAAVVSASGRLTWREA